MTRRPPQPSGAEMIAALSSDPLAGVERVYIDGTNLLFALGRGASSERGIQSGGPPPIPPGAVIGRLRAVFPPSVVVDLVFDGRPTGGVVGRLATGLRVSYSGRETADRLIDEGVAAQLALDGPAGTWGILVVTDDRELRNFVRAKGARIAGTAWLASRIGRDTGDAGGRRRGAAGDSGARPDQRSVAPRRRMPNPPGPKAGTTIGHRRSPRAPDQSDRDDR